MKTIFIILLLTTINIFPSNYKFERATIDENRFQRFIFSKDKLMVIDNQFFLEYVLYDLDGFNAIEMGNIDQMPIGLGKYNNKDCFAVVNNGEIEFRYFNSKISEEIELKNNSKKFITFNKYHSSIFNPYSGTIFFNSSGNYFLVYGYWENTQDSLFTIWSSKDNSFIGEINRSYVLGGINFLDENRFYIGSKIYSFDDNGIIDSNEVQYGHTVVDSDNQFIVTYAPYKHELSVLNKNLEILHTFKTGDLNLNRPAKLLNDKGKLIIPELINGGIFQTRCLIYDLESFLQIDSTPSKLDLRGFIFGQDFIFSFGFSAAPFMYDINHKKLTYSILNHVRIDELICTFNGQIVATENSGTYIYDNQLNFANFFNTETSYSNNIVISNNNQYALLSPLKRDVYLLDLQEGKSKYIGNFPNGILSAFFNQNESKFYILINESAVLVYDINDIENNYKIQLNHQMLYASNIPNHPYPVAFLNNNNSINPVLYDFDNNKIYSEPFNTIGLKDDIRYIKYSPSGNKMFLWNYIFDFNKSEIKSIDKNLNNMVASQFTNDSIMYLLVNRREDGWDKKYLVKYNLNTNEQTEFEPLGYIYKNTVDEAFYFNNNVNGFGVWEDKVVFATTTGLLQFSEDHITSVIESNNNKIEDDIKLFPNPAKNELIIEIINIHKYQTFEISDIMGRIVQKGRLEGEQILLEDFPKGIYFLKLIGTTETKSLKFLRE